MPADPFLRAEGLTAVRDGRELFRGLGFAVSAGDVLRVEGPNGAGKTTLLRILAGLDQEHDGQVSWPCAAAAGRPWREDVLWLGHLPGLKAGLTPVENLHFLAALRGRVVRRPIAEALARVGLSGYEDVPVGTLSAGQKRRVALARLFIEDAPVWLLDEPFTAIDRDGVIALEATLASHASDGGLVVVTTHHALGIPARSLVLGRAA